jgi:hypothetical protein
MEKLVYVVWKDPALDDVAFVEKMTGKVAADLQELGVRGLSMNLLDAEAAGAAAARITKWDPPIAGTVSVWLDLCDDRAPYERVIEQAADRIAGYLVVESVPLRNSEHPSGDGRRTPGLNLIACIERPERISYEDWIDHWHGHHKRVALETQCTFQYVRNVVVRPLTKDAPPWAGIVEESFPTEAVTDPMLWYCADGSEEKMQKNIAAMMESVQAFLDIDRVESNPMSEYRFKEVG